MKKVIPVFFLCLCLVHIAGAQTVTRRVVILNPSGNSVTLATPLAVTNNTILLPGTLGLQGAISYISSVAGSVGTTTWLNPGTNGFVLSLSAGLPVWTDPASLLAGSYWTLSGNAPTVSYNGTTGSFLGTTNTQPLVIATTNTVTAQPIKLFTNNLERARIASTGELLVGTTTPLATVTVNGETYSNTFLTQVNTSKPAYAEGRFFYDSTEKTMAYYNDHNGVTMNVGQESWIRVRNVSGATIPNGVAVYITGSDAVTRCPTVGLARANLLTTADAIGITTESMVNNAIGYVTNFGVVHQLNTSAFTAGATLYLSAITAGMLTTTRPNQPNFTNPIGYCGVSDAATGSILVINAKTRQGAMTSGAVAIGGADGFIKENPTNLFWDNTKLRLGIGTNAPTSSLTVTEPTTAASGSGIGASFNQTITAAANNDLLYGININPTFTNGAFTGLTNFALNATYAGTLQNGTAIRGKATGNGGANSEVIGIWGTASDATQGANTNAGVGVQAEGNNTTTDANSNIALKIVGGGFIVGRQAASAGNVNVAGSNLIVEDDFNGLTDQGPSGVIDITTTAPVTGNTNSTQVTLQIFNRFAKTASIVLLTVLNGGTSTIDPNESLSPIITGRTNGSFTISLSRMFPTAGGTTTGTNGTVRVGFLVVNAGK